MEPDLFLKRGFSEAELKWVDIALKHWSAISGVARKATPEMIRALRPDGQSPALFHYNTIWLLECVSKSKRMQFRADRAAVQGRKPQVTWRVIKVF